MFKSERHNVFTEEIRKTALNSNDDKRIQSIDSVDTHTEWIKISCGREKKIRE